MTYSQIQSCYKAHFNRTIKSCWIADVKRQLGLNVRRAYNRSGDEILNKCPEHIVEQIVQILNGEISCN